MSIFSCQWWYAAHAISIDSAHAISIDSAHAISPQLLLLGFGSCLRAFGSCLKKNNTNGFIVSVIFLG